MQKLSVVLLLIGLSGVLSQTTVCRYPFIRTYNKQTFTYCYFNAGETKSFARAVNTCSDLFAPVIMAKDVAGLEDLYKLYKAYDTLYLWVGATATANDPKNFRWLDGTPVSPLSFCSGHPEGGDSLCAYYSTTPVVGRERCIKTGKCEASAFNHAIICQQPY